MSNQVVPVLQAVSLSARRSGRPVLHDIDLACAAGQWTSLIGPNGAGKSTLLQTLAGLIVPDQGRVCLGGRPLPAWSGQARARQMAWLAQDTPVGHDAEVLSVHDTVALGRLPHQGWLGWPGKDARHKGTDEDARAVVRAMADTDTQSLAERTLTSLSGGERQRVWLARALAVDAPVLLLDEPASHLDAPHARLLARVLRDQAQRGRTVISAVHELSLALMADRVALLVEGRLIALAHRDDTRLHRAIEAAFDHAVAIAQVQGRWVALPQD